MNQATDKKDIDNDGTSLKSLDFDKTKLSDDAISLEDMETRELSRFEKNKKLIRIAYFVLVCTAFVETFANDSTNGLDSYATSSFEEHSLISTAAVVFKITAIVSYPILAKLNDVCGRAEGFGFSVLLYTLCYVLYASAKNVETYICAEIFYAVGKIGYRVFQQVFIADSTSLINRGLWASFPDAIAAVPSLYVGSIIQDEVMEHLTWRWGYGIWAIIMFVTCCVLTSFMFVLDKRTKKHGAVKRIAAFEDVPEGNVIKRACYFLFVKLDLFGGILLLVGLVLLFIPMTLTGGASAYRWHEPKLIAMIVVGGVIFFIFVAWNAFFAKFPFVQKGVLVRRTMILACLITALDYMENSSFHQYRKTVYQVAKYVSVGEASRIENSKKACIQIFSVICGLLMKYTKRSKIFVLVGLPILYLGHGLLVYFMNTNDHKVANKGFLYMAEVFVGVGRGFYLVALQVIVQAVAGESGIAMSTAFFLCFNSIGSLIGTCISGGIWNTLVLHNLRKYLPESEQDNAVKIYKNIKVALSYTKGTPEREAIARAYRETQQLIGWIGLGVITPTLFLMLFVDNVRLTNLIDAYQDASGEEDGVTAEEISENEKGNSVVKNQLVKPETREEKIRWWLGL